MSRKRQDGAPRKGARSGSSQPGDRTRITAKQVADVRAEMVTAVAAFDALHVIACAVADQSFSDANYRESEQAPPLALEHLVSALLERCDRAPVDNADAGDIAAATSRVLQLARAMTEMSMFIALHRANDSTTPAAQLAGWLVVKELTLRGDAYADQERSLLAEIFEGPETEAALRDAPGFTIDEGLAFEAAITEILEARVNDFELLSPAAWRRPSLVNQLSITPTVLARRAGHPLEAARRFLTAFEIPFGQPSQGGAVLWGNNAVRARPLVRVNDERWLPTSPLNLLMALRPRMEAALKPTPAWENYQAHRATVLEQRVEQHLIAALAPDAVLANVRYDIETVGTGFEADRLLRLDDRLFCVEVKAGELSARALRGDARAIKEQITSTMGHGATQARRLQDALQKEQAVRFYDRATGADVALDLENVRHVEPILITLRDHTWLYSHTGLLRAIEVLPKDGVLPWVATVHDLQVIAHLVDFPSQLTHFLARRRALPTSLHHQADELDLFMLFVQASLEGIPRYGNVTLASETEALDSYWMFQRGPRPAMKLPDAARAKLQRLGEERQPGWLREGERLIARHQANRPVVSVNSRDALASDA